MSVVNKMLKDLEARESAGSAQANYQPPQKRKSPRVIIYAVIGVVVVALVWMWLTPVKKPAPAASVPPLKQGVAETPAAKTPAPAQVTEASTSAEDAVEAQPDPVAEPVSGAAKVNVTPAISVSAPVVETTVTSEPVGTVAGSMDIKPTGTTRQGAGIREQIQLALSENDQVKAISLLRELVLQEPDNAGARKKLASLLFGQGQINQAREVLQRGIEAFPADDSLRLMLARLLQQQGLSGEAMDVLYDDAQSLPSLELVGYRASLAQALGQFEKAYKDYGRLTAQDSSNAKWWLGLGISAEKLGNADVAIRAYEEGLTLNQLGRDVQSFMRERRQILTGGQP